MVLLDFVFFNSCLRLYVSHIERVLESSRFLQQKKNTRERIKQYERRRIRNVSQDQAGSERVEARWRIGSREREETGLARLTADIPRQPVLGFIVQFCYFDPNWFSIYLASFLRSESKTTEWPISRPQMMFFATFAEILERRAKPATNTEKALFTIKTTETKKLKITGSDYSIAASPCLFRFSLLFFAFSSPNH